MKERSTKQDYLEKERRILEYMAAHGFDYAVIGRYDNFAWLTGGGDNRVLLPSEMGAGVVVVSASSRVLVAKSMDAERILEEELPEADFKLISLVWYEESIGAKVENIVKGSKTVSDFPLAGADCRIGDFYDLHYPLTDTEITRYRMLGRTAEEVIERTAGKVVPGMSEEEVKRLFRQECVDQDLESAVWIIGSDQRISRYRHCIASDKTIEQTVLLAPAFQRWGLTAPVTRMIYFGKTLPQETKDKYEAVCRIEAHTMQACVEGHRFADILEMQKRFYFETGYPEEWRRHFQGGLTGYVVNDPTRCLHPNAKIQNRQSFNWYITITGVKVEETMITADGKKEILSSTGLWPVKDFEANGEIFAMPQILIKS